MTVRWLTAFLDIPEASFEASTTFWTAVTESTLSAPRGEHDEFSTLVVKNGDSYIRAQRIQDQVPMVHLDVHSANPLDFAERAITLGATLRERRDYVVLESPSGFVFCSVPYHGESVFVPTSVSVGLTSPNGNSEREQLGNFDFSIDPRACRYVFCFSVSKATTNAIRHAVISTSLQGPRSTRQWPTMSRSAQRCVSKVQHGQA
jgi:Glyoxalase-like domain